MIKNTKVYPFARVDFYDTYAHIFFNKEVQQVLPEYSQQVINDVVNYFGKEKFILISERGLETKFNSEIIHTLNLSNMKALAIVSPDEESRRKELIKEQSFIKGSFAFFDTYEAAREWALTF